MRHDQRLSDADGDGGMLRVHYLDEGPPDLVGFGRFAIRHVPGAAGQAHTTIIGGGHFIQEDKASELANIINSFIAATALR